MSGTAVRFVCASLAIGCVGWAAYADESEFQKAYQANWQKAQQAQTEKDYARAVAHYDKVCELLPFEPTCRFQLACCHARLGNADKALAALEAAVGFGWDDPDRIETADDLKGLREHPRFAQVVKDAAACRDETVVLYAPNAVDPKRPAPAVVLLQGLGCGPRSDVPYWKAAADRAGVILVAPRAVTKVGPLMYGWHRAGARDSTAQDYFDMPAAEKRIGEALAVARKKYAIDKDRVLLAGFSQGGGVALRSLTDHPEKYCGAVAVCSLYQPPGVAVWQAVARAKPVRVVVMAGKWDRLLPRSQQAAEQLRAAGVASRYDAMEKAGHEYPSDYAEKLQKAIEFVLDREQPKR